MWVQFVAVLIHMNLLWHCGTASTSRFVSWRQAHTYSQETDPSVTGRKKNKEDCDSEQVCSGRMKVCAGSNIFQIGDSPQFDLWSSVFVLSLISVIYPCTTVCAGTRASVSQVLVMAPEPVSCRLSVWLSASPPACLITQWCLVLALASLLTSLSLCWFSCLPPAPGKLLG